MFADQSSPSVSVALKVSEVLWPDFVQEHGCVFLGRHSGSNPPPASDTATGWESFVNHTHILDEFTNCAEKIVGEDVIYLEDHPDFISACELGRRIAWLWALKLRIDFPADRFRVYYTQYDNPVVRFHKVRDGEPCWLSDDALQAATDPSFRDAQTYDTAKIHFTGQTDNSYLIQ
jgi:hypothetical protein